MPDRLSMTALREAAAGCRGCPLYADATQTVFGEGTLSSEVMLVGEQPGDQEDLAGAPFVGPAGKLLDRALDEAGIDRDSDLRHERGQALQVEGSRPAPDPRQAELDGDDGLPPLARRRARPRQAASARPARGDRRAKPARARLQGDAGPRAAARLGARRARDGDDPPERRAPLRRPGGDVRRAGRRPAPGRTSFARLNTPYTVAAPCRCKNGARRSRFRKAASATSRAAISTPPLVVARARGRPRLGRRGPRVRRLRRRPRLREPRPLRCRRCVDGDPRAGRRLPAPVLHGRDVRALRRGLPPARRAVAVPRATSQKSMLLNTGAEAVENAVKIARVATGPPGSRRLRQRLPRPHAADDDDDVEGRPVQAGLRPVRARGLPHARAVSVPRRHRGRRDRGAEAALQGRRRPRSRSPAPCSSRCRARAASSR